MKETQLNKTQNVSSGINFQLLNKEMAVKERKKKKTPMQKTIENIYQWTYFLANVYI